MRGCAFTVLLALAVGAAHGAESPGTLVSRLATGRTAEREAAFVALEEFPAAALGAEAAQLAGLVETGDWPAQCYAARLLGLAGPNAKSVAGRVDKAAAAALAEGRQTSASLLAEALARMGAGSAPTLVGALERALRGGDAGVVLAALRAAVALAAESRPLLPVAIALLDSSDAEVRALAARVVGRNGGAAAPAVAALAANLKHEEPFVAREAARALSAAGSATAPAVPALRDALRRTEPGVPEDAMGALAVVGPAAAAAYDDLAALLVGDEAPRAPAPRPRQLSAQAERAIAGIGADAVPRLLEMMKKDRERASVAARILGAMGPTAKPAAPLLLQTLAKMGGDSSNAKMTCNLAAAIIKIEPTAAEKTVPAFASVLLSDDAQAATQAADFLIRLGLATKDLYVREAIVETLTQGLAAGSRRSKGSEEFAKLCGTICLRLPEFGPAADAAVPVLKDCVFSGTPFAASAKRAWQTIRPNEKVSSAPSVESAGTSVGGDKSGDSGLDL